MPSVFGVESKTFTAQWISTGVLANGNFVINGTEYKKTGMQQVLSSNTTITCDQIEGVFTTARGGVYSTTIPWT